MKSYFLDISPLKNSGFCNQIYSILYTCGHALRNNIHFIFIGKYLKEIDTSNYCNIGEIINIDATNQFLKDYNMVLIDYFDFSFKIAEAKYGIGNTTIDVTNEIKKYCENKRFFMSRNINLNSLFGNPVKFFKDKFFISLNRNNLKLYITYAINNITCKEIYEQDCGYLKSDIFYDFENVVFAPSLRIHNDCSPFSLGLLRNITFNNNMILTAKKYIDFILWKNKNNKPNKINCIHLRLEDDAIECWSKQNDMSQLQFKTVIEEKYIDQIKKNIEKTDATLILSHNYDNKVIEFLKYNGYNYVLTPKMDKNRDIAAIYDLLIGQYCNNVYIFVYESSFSYTLLYRIYEQSNLKRIQLELVFQQSLVA
jgi:hypothetical protein